MSIGRLLNSSSVEALTEELNALPNHSVIVDKSGDNYIKEADRWHPKLIGGANRERTLTPEWLRHWAPLFVIREGTEELIQHLCDLPPLPPPPRELSIEIIKNPADRKADLLLIDRQLVAERWEVPEQLWLALQAHQPAMQINSVSGLSAEKITLSAGKITTSGSSFAIQLPKAGQS